MPMTLSVRQPLILSQPSLPILVLKLLLADLDAAWPIKVK
jgi:hypothetical protein